MSKGKEPRVDAKPPVLNPRKKQTKDSGGPSSPESLKPPCWKFKLSEITAAGRKAAEGTSVNGIIRGSRVSVLAGGVLGFAPTAVSQKMILAVSNSGRGLVGQVLSNSENGSNVEVQLCLR